MWCISPKADNAFVCQIEDVLEVHPQPYDPKQPQILVYVMPKQLLAEEHEPLLVQADTVQKQDYKLQRNGTINIFMLDEPLTGKRYIETKTYRASGDWARHENTFR